MLRAAVERAGGVVAAVEEAEAIICVDDDVEWLRAFAQPPVRWVQLGAAGIEMWLDAGVMRPDVVWTAAKGVYARPIAEHVVAFMLAGSRQFPRRLRATTWGESAGTLLAGKTVGVVGAGGIGQEVLKLLATFEMQTIALTRDGRDVGADRNLAVDGLDQLLCDSDFIILATPATRETIGLIGPRELALMKDDSWLINIARGALIDTTALVTALETCQIGGAALDVTDPEPLPDGHALWTLPNVIITPHVSNTMEMGETYLARRVEDNVRRFVRSEPLVGVVDLVEGY